MIVLAAYVAGLFLLLRELIPWAKARTSGVVQTRGHKREKVLRSQEPDGFKALLNQRFKGMAPGAVCLLGALGATVSSVLANGTA